MKQFLIACFLLATVVTTAAATEAPKGNIIYCCYANTRMAGADTSVNSLTRKEKPLL